MRSAFLSILATVITLSFGATSAGPWSGWNYVDTDGDGVCDYAGSMCAYVDEDGDGLCDVCDTYRWCGAHWRGAGRGCGRNYVDEDGDGVCDYAGSMCAYVDADGDGICDYVGGMCAYVDEDGDGICDYYASGQGRGGSQGSGSQTGRGGNYVDEDGDGICDNYTSGQSQGRGCGRGRGNCSRGRRGR